MVSESDKRMMGIVVGISHELGITPTSDMCYFLLTLHKKELITDDELHNIFMFVEVR